MLATPSRDAYVVATTGGEQGRLVIQSVLADGRAVITAREAPRAREGRGAEAEPGAEPCDGLEIQVVPASAGPSEMLARHRASVAGRDTIVHERIAPYLALAGQSSTHSAERAALEEVTAKGVSYLSTAVVAAASVWIVARFAQIALAVAFFATCGVVAVVACLVFRPGHRFGSEVIGPLVARVVLGRRRVRIPAANSTDTVESPYRRPRGGG